MKSIAVCIVLTTFFLVSCSSTGPDPAQVGITQDETGETSLNVEVNPPAKGKAVIYGRLVNLFTDEPVSGTPFLSKNLSYKDPEMPATISFSLMNDPRARYDAETGFFQFIDIDPAENYVIILSYGPGSIYIVRAEDVDYPRMIAVEAGQSLDLGTIPVEEP